MSDSGYSPSERCDNPYWIQVENHMTIEEGFAKQSLHCYADRCRAVSGNIIKMASSSGKESPHNRLVNGLTGPLDNSPTLKSGSHISTEQVIVQESKQSRCVPLSKSVISLGHSGNMCFHPQNDMDHSLGVSDIERDQSRLPFGFGGWSPIKTLPEMTEVKKSNEHEDIRRKV